MKVKVKAEDCKIKVIGYFHEYYLSFDNGDVLEIETGKSGLRLSPLFRLFDMIVIKDSSDRKRIVAYTQKLIDKLKEEGFDADAIVAAEYLKMFKMESLMVGTLQTISWLIEHEEHYDKERTA